MASGSAGGGGRASRGSGAGRKSTAAAGRRSKYSLSSGGYGSVAGITVSRKRGGVRKGEASFWFPF